MTQQPNRPIDPLTPRLKIHLIAAARPNFMKIAPLYHALKKEDWAKPHIVHTGQHYDLNMSDAFFRDLRLPDPDFHLGVGSGTHAEQTGRVMMAYEKLLLQEKPDLVIVVGDVNSTLACALATTKICFTQIIKPSSLPAGQPPTYSGHRPLLAHLEAGLRSFDRSMPEEINRIVTDSLSDILWTPSPDADENLRRQGIPDEKIIRVGNIMIDSLEMLREEIQRQQMCKQLGLRDKDYAVVTLHRPSNVDTPVVLESICDSLVQISKKIRIVFPVHPRTRKNLISFGFIRQLEETPGILLTEPVNYIRFMSLIFDCRFVLTDSGGIQEETTYLGIPCLTLRPNTERPITVEQGTNKLTTPAKMVKDADTILCADTFSSHVPELWDGRTAQRIIESIKEISGWTY